MAHIHEHNHDHNPAPVVTEVEVEAQTDFSTWTVKELRAIAVAKGLDPKSLRLKRDLIVALEALDN